MDRELIQEKIESLRRCVRRVEDKRVASVEELESDRDRQGIQRLDDFRQFARSVLDFLDERGL